MPSTAVLRSYHLPSERGEGWARIVLGSDGFFAAVSDYGNYAFMWTHHGCDDVRKFFLKAGREWDYFLHKLSPQPWTYDGELAYQAIKKRILECRREGSRWWSKARAREEWEHVHESGLREDGVVGFHRWYERTQLDDAYEYHYTSPSSHAVAFCKKTLPRWAEMLRAELDAESRGAA